MKVRFVTRVTMDVDIEVGENVDSETIYNEVVKNLDEAEISYIDEDVDIEWRTID